MGEENGPAHWSGIPLHDMSDVMREYRERLFRACERARLHPDEFWDWELSDCGNWLFGLGGERINARTGEDDGYVSPSDDEEPLAVVAGAGQLPASALGLGYAARAEHLGYPWGPWGERRARERGER